MPFFQGATNVQANGSSFNDIRGNYVVFNASTRFHHQHPDEASTNIMNNFNQGTHPDGQSNDGNFGPDYPPSPPPQFMPYYADSNRSSSFPSSPPSFPSSPPSFPSSPPSFASSPSPPPPSFTSYASPAPNSPSTYASPPPSTPSMFGSPPPSPLTTVATPPHNSTSASPNPSTAFHPQPQQFRFGAKFDSGPQTPLDAVPNSNSKTPQASSTISEVTDTTRDISKTPQASSKISNVIDTTLDVPKTPQASSKISDIIDTTLDISTTVLTALRDASQFAPVPFLQMAASITLNIVLSVQGARGNRSDFDRLATDAANYVYMVINIYEARTKQGKQMPEDLDNDLEGLVKTLKSIRDYADKKQSRRGFKSGFKRVLTANGDAGTIRAFRESLAQALNIFWLQSEIQVRQQLADIAEQQGAIHRDLKDSVVQNPNVFQHDNIGEFSRVDYSAIWSQAGGNNNKVNVMNNHN